MSHVLGREVQARRSANPDNGPSWCPAGSIRLPDMAGPTPILRTGAGAAAGETRRSLLVALVADNGTILEVVERTFHGRTRFVVQHHQIGRTLVLGA